MPDMGMPIFNEVYWEIVALIEACGGKGLAPAVVRGREMRSQSCDILRKRKYSTLGARALISDRPGFKSHL